MKKFFRLLVFAAFFLSIAVDWINGMSPFRLRFNSEFHWLKENLQSKISGPSILLPVSSVEK